MYRNPSLQKQWWISFFIWYNVFMNALFMDMTVVCETTTTASSTVERCEDPIRYQAGFMLDIVLVIIIAALTFKLLKRD